MTTQRGQTLIAMYMVVVMLSVLGGSFLTKGFVVNQHSRIQRVDAEAFYLAQGGVEDATTSFVNAIAGFQIPSNPAGYPDTNGDSVFDADFSTDTDKIITTFCAQSVTCPTSPFPAGSVPRARSYVRPAEPTERTVTEVDGTVVRLRNYEVVTRVTHPTNPSYSATLHQVITRRLIYTFQHAVFYNDDLEILPGANMTISGRLHTNADMYLDATTGRTLTIDSDYVRTPGGVYNYRKDTGAAIAGDVNIKRYNTSPVEFQLMIPGQDSSNAGWYNIALNSWLGTVKTGVHGVTALAVPSVGSIATNGFYATTAAVRITNSLIQKKNGGGYLDLVECDAATATSDPTLCVPIGTITTNTTDPANPNRYVNQRESNRIVKMTNIDVRRLGGYYDGNGDSVLDPPGSPGNPYLSQLPSNGLLYTTRNDAAPTEQPGIRLRNSGVVNRAGGLTVVSNDPVYVQGDFNTSAKKPVSIIADALHLLSNSWQDNNSYLGIGNRTASNTTFNAAFIAGIKPTAGATYSGGLENYPRLQESWSGRTLTIRGSFVELWNSQIATGNWPGTGSVYNPPTRNWAYETDFESGTLPPFTPFAVEAIRSAWWKE